MKRPTLSIIAMLIAFVSSVAFTSTATAADTSTKTSTVHQGGIRDITYQRPIVKVSALPDDTECGAYSHTRYVVTYDSSGCATGTYGAKVVVRNDSGSLSRNRLVITVEKNRTAKVVQVDSGLIRISNTDDKDPIRCDYNRSGDVIYGRFIQADGFVDIMTTEDYMKYRCYYKDGASAGRGTISVTHLKTSGYVFDHTKMETVTAGYNNSRSNVPATFWLVTPNNDVYVIEAAPGETNTATFPYEGSGMYMLYGEQYGGAMEFLDEVDVSDPDSGK